MVMNRKKEKKRGNNGVAVTFTSARLAQIPW